MIIMTKKFVCGAYVDVTEIISPSSDTPLITQRNVDIGNEMLQSAYKHFLSYNELNPPAKGIVWLQSTTGFMVVCTPYSEYADQLRSFIAGLK